MEILDTPAAFRPPPIPYPNHSVGPTLEVAAYQYLKAHQHEIESSLVYLPIFWQSCYWADRTAKKTHDVGAVPEIQQFLDTKLDPSKTYFTVSQADEGAYERLPSNVIMFSGGGVGHIAVPLLCDDHVPVHANRTLLASFIGTIETAGPALNLLANPTAPRPSRSSWFVDGQGAMVRRAMRDAFAGRSDTVIQTTLRGPEAKKRFIELACSSVFALSPRGYGCTSFRMYEAMKLGAIPVYIYDDCWLPYGDSLDWERLGVLCHYKDVAGLPARLAAINQHEIKSYRQYAADVIPHFFTMEGAAKQIARYVRSMNKPTLQPEVLNSYNDDDGYFLKRFPEAIVPYPPIAYDGSGCGVHVSVQSKGGEVWMEGSPVVRAMLYNMEKSRIIESVGW